MEPSEPRRACYWTALFLRNKCPSNGSLSINIDIRDVTSVDEWFRFSLSSCDSEGQVY